MPVSVRRLWLSATGEVVLDGDPAAATLLVAVGQEMPGGVVDPFDDPAGDVKSVEPPVNKMVRAPRNKSA